MDKWAFDAEKPVDTMPNMKKEAVYFRAGSKRKEQWAQAAALQGISLTEFIEMAADNAANAALKKPPDLEEFAFNLTNDATQGGASNYAKLGQQLTLAIIYRWPKSIISLKRILSGEACDDEKVLTWFGDYTPGIVTALPKRRRSQFVKGVRLAI